MQVFSYFHKILALHLSICFAFQYFHLLKVTLLSQRVILAGGFYFRSAQGFTYYSAFTIQPLVSSHC